VILADGDTILPRHLNLSFVNSALEEAPINPWAHVDMSGTLTDVTRRAIAGVEKLKIEEALKEAEGSKGRAAELLQISYKALISKLKEYRME
jgi:DNA-binding NtrC family response regulator